jgi:hypothetical protein
MLGFNGGLMGVRRTPTQGIASGLWFQNEQSVAKRANLWPLNNPIAALSPTLWYDFADAATVTTSSGQITQVNDKGSQGFNLARDTAAVGPSYSAIINGLYCSDFGTMPVTQDKRLFNASSTSFDIAEIYMVLDNATTFGDGAAYGMISSMLSSVGSYQYNGGYDQLFGNPFNAAYINNSSTNVHNVEGAWTPLNSPALLRIKKVDDSAYSTTGGIQLGRDREYTGREWAGVMGEVVVFSTVLTSTDRASVQNFLATKWGLTLS